MANRLPDFDLMKSFFPATQSAENVKILIGKDVNQSHYKNTCVIRVSRALNYAGHLIPRDSKAFRTKQGNDKFWYGLRVLEFRKYMLDNFGPPTISVKRSSKSKITPAQFRGYRGIICLAVDGWNDATGHFSLWNINRMLQGDPNYFDRAQEGLLWVADDPSHRWSTPEV